MLNNKKILFSMSFILMLIIIAIPNMHVMAESERKIVDIELPETQEIVLFDGITGSDINSYLSDYKITIIYDDDTSDTISSNSSGPDGNGGRIYTLTAPNGENLTLKLLKENKSVTFFYFDHCIVLPGEYTISVSCGSIIEETPLTVTVKNFSEFLKPENSISINYNSDNPYYHPIQVDKKGEYVFRYGDFVKEGYGDYYDENRKTEIDIKASLFEINNEEIICNEIELLSADALEDFDTFNLHKKSYSFTLSLEPGKTYILYTEPCYYQAKGELEMNIKKQVSSLNIEGKEVFENIFSIFGSTSSGWGEKFDPPTVTINYEDGTTETIHDWIKPDRSGGDNTSYFFHYLSSIGKNIYLKLQNEEGEDILWPYRNKLPVGTYKYVVYIGNFNDDEETYKTKKPITIQFPSDIPELTTGINETFHEIQYTSDGYTENRLYSHFCPDTTGKYKFNISKSNAAKLYQFDGKQLSVIEESYNAGMPLVADDLTQGQNYYLEIFDATKDDEKVEIVKADEDGYFIKGITIIHQPTKTIYTEGELFDPTGLSIGIIDEAQYTNTIPITNSTTYTIEPSRPLQPDDKEITITYGEWKTSIPITVKKKPDPSQPNTNTNQQNNKDTTINQEENKNTTTNQNKDNEKKNISKQKQQIKKTKVSLKKLKSTKKKTLQITWKKQKNITGYEIQICTSKKFKKGVKKYTIKKSSSTSKTIKKLKSKKKYYIRIRAYRNIKNKKYYGPWGKVQSIKVK